VLVLGGIGVVALANTEAIFSALGKDPTLTGRTPMWLAVIDMIERRPLLGYGYSAFWGGLESASAPVLLRLGWNTPHAHNGFLDILLQLGAVGMIVFLFALFTAAREGVRLVRKDHGTVALWPLLFLSFLVLYNITETTVLQQNNVYWSLYAATVFAWMAPSWVRKREAEAEAAAETPEAEQGWTDAPAAELGTLTGAERRYAADQAT
jgi:O-antigen ligase